MIKNMHIDYDKYDYTKQDKDDLAFIEFLYNKGVFQSRCTQLIRYGFATVSGLLIGAGISSLINYISNESASLHYALYGAFLPVAGIKTGILMGMENEHQDTLYRKMSDLKHIHDSIVGKYSGEQVDNPMTLDDYFNKTSDDETLTK